MGLTYPPVMMEDIHIHDMVKEETLSKNLS